MPCRPAATPHFVIKYDKADARLVPYLARHLETVYGEIRQQFGYEPPGPTLVEIFNESQGQSGHAWFSARMIGLPYLETVAASTRADRGHGLARRNADARQLCLGPHAEARDDPRLQSAADRLQHPALVYRGPGGLQREDSAALSLDAVAAAAGGGRDLDEPGNGERRFRPGDERRRLPVGLLPERAVCRVHARAKGGDAPKKMVAAYAENPSTDAAIRKVFGVSQAEFERGYTAFLRKQIDATPVLAAAETERSTNWKRPIAGSRRTRSVAARLALAYFQRGRRRKPRSWPPRALKLQPKQPLATYVLVRLQKAGTPKEAMAKLESCLDRKAPEPAGVEPSGRLETEGREIRRGRRALRPGRALGSGESAMDGRPGEGLSGGGLRSQNLAQALVRFAQIEPDDLPSRKKLAELALERREAAVARRWATEALEIQVEDADAHRLLAAALVELNELDGAIEEFEAAIELNPAHLQQRFALADALVQARQPAKAKKVLEELLRRDPKFPGADTLLESLEKKP